MALTPSVEALGQRSACAVRATRLDATCTPLSGDNNGVVAAAMVTATFTPDVEEGTKLEPKDACGNISFTTADPDVTKRYNIAIEFNTWNLALLEILTDASVMLGKVGSPWAGKIAGIARPGSNTPHENGAALEIWSKTALGDGACGAVADVPPYVRHIIPRVYLRPDDVSFANDVITMKMAGWGTANPSWGSGPYGDWQMAADLAADTPFASMYDDDIPDTGAGYINVPSS